MKLVKLKEFFEEFKNMGWSALQLHPKLEIYFCWCRSADPPLLMGFLADFYKCLGQIFVAFLSNTHALAQPLSIFTKCVHFFLPEVTTHFAVIQSKHLFAWSIFPMLRRPYGAWKCTLKIVSCLKQKVWAPIKVSHVILMGCMNVKTQGFFWIFSHFCVTMTIFE